MVSKLRFEVVYKILPGGVGKILGGHGVPHQREVTSLTTLRRAAQEGMQRCRCKQPPSQAVESPITAVCMHADIGKI